MATAPTIDEFGISAPSYADVLDELQTIYRAIYGADIYLEADSQDGQFLAAIASAINDSNAAAVAVYNAFSPATAQGNGLSSNVKINGIQRLIPSQSAVDLRIVGQVGAVITNGKASDEAGENTWLLPASVTIPLAGEITVTALCETSGQISASAGTITKIQTPTFGWQSVSNPSDAEPGNPLETDAALRLRQSISVAVPSQTIFEGIIGSVANIVGVNRIKGYENDQDDPDANGIPGHTIAVVVEGGDAQDIFQTIADKKTPGTGTFGDLEQTVIDSVNSVHIIRFSRPIILDIAVAIEIEPLSGYSASILPIIKAAVFEFINALEIGEQVIYSKIYVPANLNNSALGETYNITSLMISLVGDTPAAANIAVDFNEAAQIIDDDITITVAS